nr:PLxRFG domain-containing protein [Acidovorax sp. sif1233]
MNATDLDQGRGQDYWTRPHELAARAFQGYVEDKIAERGGRSPFLNYGPENAVIATPWGFKRPFPAGAERAAINQSLDRLVEVIQTREGEDGGVALFRREATESEAGAAEFDAQAFLNVVQRPAAYSEAAQRQAVDSVSATVDAIRSAWGPNAPAVVVAFDMQDPRVPEAARRADLRQRSGGARGAPEGFYYRGKAYLMASRLNTPTDAARVLFHEVLGHHGLRGNFGRELDLVLNQVATMREAEVAAKIQEYGLRGVRELSVREAAEEVLAEMAEKNPRLHFVQRAVAAIRNFLRAHVPGFRNLRMTDDDIIQAYILPARGWVERGGDGGGTSGDPGFSRADDSPLRQASTFTEARVAAQEFQGKALTNEATGLQANVSRNTLDKMLSRKAVEKSASAQAQSRAVANLDHLYQGAIFGWSKEDRDGNTNVRAVHRFFVPMDMDGRMLMAKLTVKETVDANHANPLYTVEAVDFNEKSPAAVWVDASAKADGIDLTSIRSAGDVLSLAQEIEQRNAEDDGDTMFSRSKLQEMKASALDQIQQALSHPGKVSLWDKSVGTMRHLGERAPAFKPVFESAQRFIDDVALLANDAADFAPRLLPRVDSWRDLTKKPISAEDNKALARPLFEGTLMWGRDVDGKPVLADDLTAKYASMSADDKAQLMLAAGRIEPSVLQMWRGLPLPQFEASVNSRFEGKVLKPGVVWTGDELRGMFGLTDQQVSLYQEARAAIDRSIDVTTRADMLRALGDQYAPMRDAVLEQATLADAMELLTRTLQDDARGDPDQADRLMALNNQVVDRYERAKELMAEGYAPLSRFGRYTVDVVDAAGERQYFGMFETMREANQMRMRLASAFPGAAVTSGTMSQEAYKLFQGITPESLEMFGNMLGLSAEGSDARDKAFQEYLKLAKNNHSALKRLIHRKGIAGYSEDVGRVLASFVYSNARQGAGALNAGTMETAINNIPKEQGELRDVAVGLQGYIRDPQEEGQAVRGMLFAQYLGGSLASAFVNTTQPFTVTLPWLSQFGGMRAAGTQMGRALKDMGTKGFRYEADLAAALQHAEDDGVVSPQEIHQLMAQARGAGTLRTGDGTRLGDARATAANHWERAKVAWGQPFALAEQFNRRSTFIAAYRLAKEKGLDRPADFARRAVLETQFLYSKANKPKWGRGAVGGTLMTFKTYSISYLELMQRTWNAGEPGSPERAAGRRAVGWAVAMLMLMGGAGGLPFMEDLEDLIDGVGQLMGYNLSTKQWRKQVLRDALGKELATFMEQGVSGLPGAPIDVSGRLGMGNLIPGTGLFLTKPNRERDLLEVAGPAGDLVARGFGAARKALTGDVGGAALEVAPTAVRNAAKGIDMATSGIYKDTKGYKVIDTTLDEAVAKAIGFQPRSVAEVQESNSFMQRSKSFYVQTSSDIKAQWAQALFNKDEAALERVRERLADWNRNNPEQPIVVKMPDVWKKVREMGKDRTQRIADTAPKALRQQMRELAKEQA